MWTRAAAVQHRRMARYEPDLVRSPRYAAGLEWHIWPCSPAETHRRSGDGPNDSDQWLAPVAPQFADLIIPARHVAILICIDTATIDGWHTAALDADADADADPRLRARLHHGRQSHEVIVLSATGHLGMATSGQIRLTVVSRRSGGTGLTHSDSRSWVARIGECSLQGPRGERAAPASFTRRSSGGFDALFAEGRQAGYALADPQVPK